MKIFINHIEKILKRDDRLWSKDKDKKLLKNQLVGLVSNDDEKLLELLLKDSEAKKHFFKKTKKSVVFLKDRFLQFITMNEFLPDSFTAFENEIGLSDDKKLITQKDEISLAFPHKDCILEGGQTKEEAGREEIFYNTILVPDEIDRIKEPKVLVNWKKFDKDGWHKIKEISKKDNWIIKGNNLLALYSLLPKYRGEIKLIYIDPPYNTGNDEFRYNDRFNHSAWLTFMKNRLDISRELLRDDGAIFVQCDDNEQAYLKVLMDEIFRENNLFNITMKITSESGIKVMANKPVKVKEYVLVYGKIRGAFKYKRQYVISGYDANYSYFVENPNEDHKKWIIKNIKGKYSEIYNKKEISKKNLNKFQIDYKDNIFSVRAISDKLKEIAEKNPEKIIKVKNKNNVETFIWKKGEIVFINKKVKKVDGKLFLTKYLSDFWNDISYDGIAKEGGVTLKKGKKPEALLKRIIDMATEKNDIVLDFFAGAGTTGAVAHKMGRRYILVEQMDYIHELPEQRLKNVIKGGQTGISKTVNWKGGGSFIYMELLEWNQKYINQLEKAKTQKKIIGIYKKIEKEQFYKYKYEPKKFDLKQFKELDLKDQKRALLDILDMNHLYVNNSSINDATFKVDEKDKKLTKMFYEEK